MRRIVEDVKFVQDGTLVFGDLHIGDGYVERIDYKTPPMTSAIAIPGFIDIHTHGCVGISTEETDKAKLHALAKGYSKQGVTSFCPTLRAKSLDAYAKQIEAWHDAFQDEVIGARFLGVHLEGPYLSRKISDTKKHTDIQDIDLCQLEAFLSRYHEDIRMMTIAPELPQAMEAIRLLHLYGVQVSLGHTNASYEVVAQALETGAVCINHLFNRMPPIDHRHACMLDAVLLSDCKCEIIMDGVHIQKHMLEWLLPLLGSQRVFAVSGADPRKQDTFTMLDAFRYLYPRFELQACQAMCGGNAAKEMKCHTQDIQLGRKVDLVVLNAQLEVQDVIMDGRSVLSL